MSTHVTPIRDLTFSRAFLWQGTDMEHPATPDRLAIDCLNARIFDLRLVMWDWAPFTASCAELFARYPCLCKSIVENGHLVIIGKKEILEQGLQTACEAAQDTWNSADSRSEISAVGEADEEDSGKAVQNIADAAQSKNNVFYHWPKGEYTGMYDYVQEFLCRQGNVDNVGECLASVLAGIKDKHTDMSGYYLALNEKCDGWSYRDMWNPEVGKKRYKDRTEYTYGQLCAATALLRDAYWAGYAGHWLKDLYAVPSNWALCERVSPGAEDVERSVLGGLSLAVCARGRRLRKGAFERIQSMCSKSNEELRKEGAAKKIIEDIDGARLKWATHARREGERAPESAWEEFRKQLAGAEGALGKALGIKCSVEPVREWGVGDLRALVRDVVGRVEERLPPKWRDHVHAFVGFGERGRGREAGDTEGELEREGDGQ